MGLFRMYNCCIPCLLEYLKSYLQSESRLHISEFSVHCTYCQFKFEPSIERWFELFSATKYFPLFKSQVFKNFAQRALWTRFFIDGQWNPNMTSYESRHRPFLRRRQVQYIGAIENKIYIRVEFRQSLGMNFFSLFQPEREFKVYKSCKCSAIICRRRVH